MKSKKSLGVMKLNFFACFCKVRLVSLIAQCISTMTSLSSSFFGSILLPPDSIYYWPPPMSMFLVKDSLETSIILVNSIATYSKPSLVQSPNQSITQRLNKAGELAVLLEKSGFDGFIVKTTWRFLCTSLVNCL